MPSYVHHSSQLERTSANTRERRGKREIYEKIVLRWKGFKPRETQRDRDRQRQTGTDRDRRRQTETVAAERKTLSFRNHSIDL